MSRTIFTIFLLTYSLLAANFDKIIKKTIDAGQLKKVEVFTTNGNVYIEGIEGNQLRLTATKQIKGSESEKDKLLNSLKIIVYEHDGILTIKVERPSKKRSGLLSWLFDLGVGEYRVDFDLEIPKHLMVKARSTNGKIEVHNFPGKLNLGTTNGEIRALGVNQLQELYSTNGNVYVEFKALPTVEKELAISTTNGEISVLVPEKSEFNLKAFTTNGEIDYGLKITGRQSKSKNHLEIINGEDLVTLILRTTNGDISVFGR